MGSPALPQSIVMRSIRAGKPLDWNGTRGEFTNVPEANKYLREAYQNGWSLESV